MIIDVINIIIVIISIVIIIIWLFEFIVDHRSYCYYYYLLYAATVPLQPMSTKENVSSCQKLFQQLLQYCTVRCCHEPARLHYVVW